MRADKLLEHRFGATFSALKGSKDEWESVTSALNCASADPSQAAGRGHSSE